MPLDYFSISENFICKVNGHLVRLVEEFDDTNDIQVMILGKILYFNKQLTSGDTIEVKYYHYTGYVIIQAIMKTNTVYESPDAPKILNFDVELS